jgi:hypothetical protein
MKLTIKVLLAICSLSIFANAQANPQKAIRGVWKVAEIVTTGDGAGTISNPQPGLMMFGRKYYSIMYVASDKERPIYAAAAPTKEEKVAAFDSLLANAGAYEISGKTLTIRPTVARNPGFTGGGFATYQIRVEGNTLWLTNKTGDFSFRVAGKIVPLTGPPSETAIKLVRLE